MLNGVTTMVPRVLLIFVLLTGLLAGCRQPGPGSVSGQIKHLTPEGGVQNLVGAQVVLRGARDTFTTVSNAGEGSGDEQDGTYNYRFDQVPPGTYTMAVTPPPGSNLQPETDIPPFEVKADEQFPQSVMLLPEGVAKPRPLAPSELNPGEVGYVNQRGERVVYQQGSGLDMTDFLLMYMLFRSPPLFGYGAPPVIMNSPGTSTGPRYRVDAPPATSTSGQRVTTRPPSVPGQGSTRPGGAPASGGAGPTYRPPSSNGTGPNTATSPNGSAGTTAKPSAPSDAPSQGVTRPSSGSSSPRISVPSGGGSRGGRR
jgi:hypothetical protein